MILIASALLLLGAHCLRIGLPVLAILCLAALALLGVRRRWAARLLQGVLLLGTLEWMRTLVLRVMERRPAGEPFLRYALIVGAVTLLTGLAALRFRSGAMRRRFGLGSVETSASAEDAPQ